jgi:beta-lactam-binding protein with PASTA domain
MVAVPDVTGDEIADAYTTLHAAGLRVAIPHSYAYALTRPPIAVSQAPGVGTEVAKGSTVSLALDRGPTERPMYTGHQVTIPDLTGMPAGLAARQLAGMGLGFHIAQVPPLEASDAPTLLDAYRVIAQTVEPGTVVSGRERRRDRNVGLYVEPIA